MASSSKKNIINIESYNALLAQNSLLPELLEQMGSKYDFPIESALEIGTGTGTYLTKYLVLKERAKEIGKFYGMEPISEFFEESKKHVVRLSRTDATTQEYFGGNPFNIVTFAFVLGHIYPDKKKAFIKNIMNNIDDFDGGKLIVMDAFIPDYKNEEERHEKVKEFLKANIDYYKSIGNQFMVDYFTGVLNEEHDDYFVGDHKISVEKYEDILKSVGFQDIKTTLFKGSGKGDWEKMGYYFVVASKV